MVYVYVHVCFIKSKNPCFVTLGCITCKNMTSSNIGLGLEKSEAFL